MLEVAAAVNSVNYVDDGESLLTSEWNLQEADEHPLCINGDGAGSTSPLMEACNQNMEGDFDGCEPNLIRAFDDMYTPRWIRGIGREKEGLCPVCFEKGTLNWRRMKCSAYW
ncbi:hypothetical protein IWW36_003108 [Coemansia brasiliensis]|uniref:Transcription regulator Rua1 C-terminal domain-containing protein n=1 Tax=Coemansia brasiliensis TaxID=2650707 RepID=A0A9W8M019_9FUNG|nr:hypothetical protein IWW36_003108 [Coemansia brasiliensis]